jgi:hypothetical protein
MVLIPKMIQNKTKDIGIKLSNTTFLKVVAAERVPGTDPNEAWRNYWEGIVAPGALFVEQMFRRSGPYASELSLIAYNEYFPIDSLQHIFLVNILNEDTKRFILTELYTPKNRLSWPDPSPRMWKAGSDEYRGLLGSKLGRVVARLVLGAFERGTLQICQIVTWQEKSQLHIRFDLEKVSVFRGLLETELIDCHV